MHKFLIGCSLVVIGVRSRNVGRVWKVMYQPRRTLSQIHIMNSTFYKGKDNLLKQMLRPIGEVAAPTPLNQPLVVIEL